MGDLTIGQKKEWAKLLYTKENLTQAEIAERVGVTRVTVNKWINAGNWETLKISISMTNEEQLKNLYRQLAEIQNTILGREDKARYAMPAEAEVIRKLTISIKGLQADLGLSEITSVFGGLIQFLRTYEPKLIKEITPVLDAYVKSKLA
ncbi:MAG: helix-turn-helix domain-containing protein [Dysgonamonadaceae bacterium]|jgi:transcriptional regulator with XRE-family HTH domain|nr:helix-turn-helix domain-containing protein [Dysgonamonadaceae bacterium]